MATQRTVAVLVGSLRKASFSRKMAKALIAVGTDACSGGLTTENGVTASGIDAVLPVDVYVPGSPPPPIAVLHALLLAVVGGLAMGFALGLNRTSAEVAEPILVSVYSLPKVTLYPLILLIFGLGVPAWRSGPCTASSRSRSSR